MSYYDDVKNYEEFNKKFSIEHLSLMTLEKYVNDKEKDGFLWWMLKTFGNLGSFYKSNKVNFGIYKCGQNPKYGTLKEDKHGFEAPYVWNKEFGDNTDKAFETIKKTIIKIAQEAQKLPKDRQINDEDIKGILQTIDKINFPNSLKWKIAFLYSNNNLIDWYASYWLRTFIEKLEPNNTFHSTSTADMQFELMRIRKEKFNGNDEDFYRKLYSIFINSDLTELLESTHNIILHGAPGTGKTYLAKKIAKEMKAEVGFVQFHPSYDYTDFVEGLRPVNKNKEADKDSTQIGFERKDGVFKEFCKKALEAAQANKTTFDMAYLRLQTDISNGKNTYITLQQAAPFTVSVKNEEILNIIPESSSAPDPRTIYKKELRSFFEENGTISKNSENSSYIKALAKILQNEYLSPKKYVFIIDEINRGEMSKIFGELFYSIDPGYRVDVSKIEKEKPITIRTQYANMQDSPNEFDKELGIQAAAANKDNYGHFFVPDNVYIIGTMNDIDRSVESMDFAMRRRFTFQEIKAEDNIGMLDELDDETKKKAIDKMKGLNNAIEKINGLSSAYHIGAAYFLKLKDLNNNFKLLWEYHLEPLLKEYLRGQDIDGKRLKDLKDIFFQKSKKNSKNQPDIPEDDDEDNYGAEEQ